MRLVALLFLCLLPAVLLAGGAAVKDSKQEAAAPLDVFMEEMRGALARQWELLQNLRYHTLSVKVRLIQLEAQLQSLSKRLSTEAGGEADTHVPEAKESCGGSGTDIGDATEKDEKRDEDEDMKSLLEAMRNLTQVYSILADSTKLCGKKSTSSLPTTTTTTTTSTITTTTTPSTTTTITTPNTKPPTDVNHEDEDKEKHKEEEEKEEKEDAKELELPFTTNITAHFGSSVVMRCHLDPLQDPKQAVWIRVRDHNWLSQGKHKIAADEIRISVGFDPDLDYYLLYLEDVRKEDEGAYVCQLSTDSGMRQTTWLIVDLPLSPPRLKQFPRDKQALEGHDVILKCRALGQPQPVITWIRNGLEVSPSARYRITSTGNLVIRDLRSNDTGQYVCRAKNSEGQTESAAGLLTVVQPHLTIKGPRDMEVMVGEDAVFKCRVRDHERLILEWFKDDVALNFTTNPKFSLQPNHTLLLSSAALEDSGTYTCRATTPFASAFASASLTVQEPTTTTTSTTLQTPIPFSPHLDYCPPPYKRIDKYVCVMQVTHVKLNWDDAAEYCRNEGGKLAWENEATANNRILQDFLEVQYGLGRSRMSSNTRWPFWVGGWESTNGMWSWEDGSPVSASLWAPQHRRPSGRQATRGSWCLILDGYQGYQATALPCTSKRYFLCRLK